MDELREYLAAYAHAAWASWMAYLFDNAIRNPDGSVTIPAGYVAALSRQIEAPYTALSKAEQDSDRAEADKMLALIWPVLNAAEARAERLRRSVERGDEDIGALAAVLTEAMEERDALARECQGLQLALVAVSEQNDRAVAWLRQYGQHAPECGAVRGYPPCDCGLDGLRG